MHAFASRSLCCLPSPVLAVAVAGALLLSGCATIPEGRSAIDSVAIVNAGALDGRDVAEKLATTESPRFLGLFPGLFYEYEIFDAAMLQRDLARVERYYRGHGFLEAHARAGRVVHERNDHVRIEIVVDPGPPTVDRNLRIDGLDELPRTIADDVREAAAKALPPGTRFEEDAYAKAQTRIARALTDRGYAYATLKADAQADLSAHAIDYVFTVHAGPPAVFGPVTLVQDADPSNKGCPEPRPDIGTACSQPNLSCSYGACKGGIALQCTGGLWQQEATACLDEAPLQRALHIHPGEPYSKSAIEAATQALLDLEVLSAVQIVPALPDPPASVVPLTVYVQPGKMHSIRLGGGFEFDEIKTELHGLVGWEDHNFFGDLRDFTVEFKPGVVLYPMRSDNIVKPTNPLPEERTRLNLKQPGFIEPRTTLFVQPEGNVFPMLVAPDPASDQPVLGYGELKGTIGVERRFGKHVLVRLGETVQSEFPFAYTSLQLTQQVPPIVLTYPQLITQLDLRDDPIHTHSGIFLSNDVSVASGPYLGYASDVRVQPEARGYIPITRHITFAARATVGFLFAFNYGDYVQNHLQDTLDPNSVSSQRLYQVVDRDIEIVYFRGFFGGGPSSNRGYPLRGIAPHGVVPFLSPATLAAQQAASTGKTLSCVPGQPGYNPTTCEIPVGGFTMWEGSIEVRFDISGPLGTTLFCDTGDVAPGEVQLRFNHLDLSCGAGARYDTPVGAIRLDLAYRIPGLQVIGSETAAQQREDGTAPLYFNTIPIALAFGIGETF